MPLKRFYDREVARGRDACEVSVPRAVQDDALALVIAGAAQEGAVRKGRTAGVELGNEGVITAAVAAVAGGDGRIPGLFRQTAAVREVHYGIR